MSVVGRSSPTPVAHACGYDAGMTAAPSATATLTSARILNAAVELFYKRGFRGTTIRDIVERCGLTPGSLYVYYPSKNALLQSIVSETNRRLGQQLAIARSAAGPSASEQLAALTAAFAEFVDGNREVSLVAEIEWRHLSGQELKQVRAIRRAISEDLAELIMNGVESGEFTLPVHADGQGGARQLSWAILAQILGIAREPSNSAAASANAPAVFAELALRQVGYRKPTRRSAKTSA